MPTPKEALLRILRHEQTACIPPPETQIILGIGHKYGNFYNPGPDLKEWKDAWGVGFRRGDDPQNQSAYPVSHPLERPEDFDKIPWPDPDDPDLLTDTEKYLEQFNLEEKLVQAANPGALFVRAWLLLGMENFMICAAEDPNQLTPLLDRITDYQVRIAERFVELGVVDIGLVCDDAGTNKGLFIRPALWRELIKPRMQRIFNVYKDAGCFTNLHCCGCVMEIIDDLLDMGIDILNPVQVSANDLDELRRRTQGRITLLGGIDCRVVYDGTPEEVAALTRETIRRLGANGDYLPGPDQGLPFPKENIAALHDAIRNSATCIDDKKEP